MSAKTTSVSAKIRARLLKMAENKRQGNVSQAGIARQFGVTPALVSQIKAALIDEGVSFDTYDVNKFRGRPVTK